MLEFQSMKRGSRFLFLLVFVSGCAHGAAGPKAAPAARAEVASQNRCEIVNRPRLYKGGALLIVPFSPGVDVAATDDVERISLRIVKGAAELLQEKAPRLEVLLAQNAERAELVLRGRVTKLEDPVGLRNKWFSHRQKSLEVKGEMLDSRTNETVLTFSVQLAATAQSESFDDLGQRIGRQIAERIAGELNSSS